MTEKPDTLEWLRAHRPAIHKVAKTFLPVASNPSPLLGNDLEKVERAVSLPWDSSDQQREVILGATLAYQLCRRSLELGFLNRLILLATDNQAGLDVYPVVDELNEDGLLCLIQDHDYGPPCEEYNVFLIKGVFELLSGLIHPAQPGDPEDIASIDTVEQTATPLLLLRIGRLYEEKFRCPSWHDVNRQPKGFTKPERAFVEIATNLLVERLSQSNCDSLQGATLDELFVHLLAFMFSRKVAGRFLSVEDTLCVAQRDPRIEIEIFRRMRGELKESGVVDVMRGTQYQLDEDLFGELIELDDSRNGPDFSISLTAIEDRMKPTIPTERPDKKRKNDDDDDDNGDENDFAWLEN
ncbi:MAG: hypothetical protein KC964_28825 [Candidatus Omnitrophica bacterium]|nr:hypothetical protein [Candidatus Omnitrophota bacterium]